MKQLHDMACGRVVSWGCFESFDAVRVAPMASILSRKASASGIGGTSHGATGIFRARKMVNCANSLAICHRNVDAGKRSANTDITIAGAKGEGNDGSQV